ncbi:hypothetical protein ACWDTT_10570 [Streptosporangium sandarakinum]
MDLNAPFRLPTDDAPRTPVTDPSVLEASRRVLEASVQTTQVRAPEANTVTLPGGLNIGGQWVRTARVRELDGYAEEELGKAALSGLQEKPVDALLRAGVTHLGDVAATPALLDELLGGDGNALILAIRRATYGKTLEFSTLICPHCRAELEVKYDLGDVPTSELGQQGNLVEVGLRGGRTAQVRLINRGDEKAVLAASRQAELSRPEQESILLSRCVISITGPEGARQLGGDLDAVRRLAMPDRQAIMAALDGQRVGPRFEEAVVTCSDCERSVEVPITLDTLFRS